MVELEEKVYKSLAAKSGLPLQFVFKEYRIMELITQLITVQPNLKIPIIMKGGTALNKAYFMDNQRFSEDIDFDYVSSETKEEKVKKLQNLLKNIKGFTIEGPWKFYSTIRFHCIYTFRGRRDHVRIEFNLKEKRATLEAPVIQPITSSIFGTSSTGLYIYYFDDLLAGKLNALRERCEGKDIWDSFYGMGKTKNIKGAVSKMLETESQNISVDSFFRQIVEKLEKANSKELLKTTNPYIPTKLRPKNWEDMIKSLIARMKNYK